jgi:hypothetical protein
MGVRNHLTRPVRRAMAVAVMSACASSAFAIEFETDGGWRGSLNTTVGISSAWRAQAPDKTLIMSKNAAGAGLVPGVTALDGYPGVSPAAYLIYAAPTGPIVAGVGAVLTAAGGNVVAAAGNVRNSVYARLAAAGVSNEVAFAAGSGAQSAYIKALQSGVQTAAALTGVAVQGAVGSLALADASRKGVAAGFLGGAPTDDANLNYDKGDRYSTNLKVISELAISKGDTGGLLRVKGWYDQALKDESVPWGHQASGYAANKPMSDDGFELLNRFQGLALLDAYAYTSVDLGNMPMQIRLGRQAVNWGESLFIQGLNQLTPLDVTALRKPGTEIKEALLPVWSIYGNLGLPGGMSAEAFYQFKWEPSVIDTCGTYWSPVGTGLGNKPGLCNMATAVGFNGLANRAAYLGSDWTAGGISGPGYLDANSTSVLSIDHPDPKNSGQWGLALRFPVESLDTEFGLYAMNIHSRTPILSGIVSGPGIAASAISTSTVGRNMVGFWEYPEDIKIYGLSAATTIAGWSVGAELSLQKDVPVQINGNDLLAAGVFGGVAIPGAFDFTVLGRGGPAGDRTTAARIGMVAAGQTNALAGSGASLQGYDRYDKTQFQVNGVYLLPALVGATNGVLVAEAGFQWNNVPENDGINTRYGRSFIYGFASHSKYAAINAIAGPGNNNATGDTCANQSVGAALYNPSPEGCQNDGFVTDFAWGYRIKASLDYPNVFESSWTATPSVYFLHDVSGYSLDTQFNEGRKAISLGLRMSLNKVHNLDLNFTTYADSAKYDANRDRDNYSIAYSYTF